MLGGWELILPGCARFRFSAAATGNVQVMADPGVGPSRVRRAFQNEIWPYVRVARGDFVLHASAIRVAEGLVAFVGPSGAGKSTLARRLGRLGYSWRGDDALVVDPSSPAAWALPRAGRPAPSPPEPLAAVFLLDRSARSEIAVVPFGATASFETLVANSFCFSLAGELGRRLCAASLELLGQVPVARLRYSNGPAGIAAVAERLARLDELFSPRRAARPPTWSPSGRESTSHPTTRWDSPVGRRPAS